MSETLATLGACYRAWCGLPLGLRFWLVLVHLITLEVVRLGLLALLTHLHVRWGGA